MRPVATTLVFLGCNSKAVQNCAWNAENKNKLTLLSLYHTPPTRKESRVILAHGNEFLFMGLEEVKINLLEFKEENLEIFNTFNLFFPLMFLWATLGVLMRIHILTTLEKTQAMGFCIHWQSLLNKKLSTNLL